MTSTLFVKLPAANQSAADITVDWALYDAQLQKTAGGYAEPLSVIREKVADTEPLVVALAPGSDVLQTWLQVPAGQKRHLQRTLPFLVEEDIAAPIEEMHLCASPVKQGQTQVLAVSHALMQHWLELLKAQQLEADWLLPESAGLGLSTELEILIDGSGAYLYCINQPLINSEANNLSFIADRLIAGFSEQQRPGSALLSIAANASETDRSCAEALAAQFEVEGLQLQRQTIEKQL